MKKLEKWYQTDLGFFATKERILLLRDKIIILSDSRGRLSFLLRDFKDVTFQITTKGKLGIFYPEGISPDKCLEKVKSVLVRADGAPVRIFSLIKETTRVPSKRRRQGRRDTLGHRRQLSLGLEAILAEDWYLYRYQEDSRERAKWKEKIERDGIRYKPFAIEHLRSGYPDTYDKLKRWRKLKENLLSEGNSEHDVAEVVASAFFGEFPMSGARRNLLVQGIALYRALRSDLELIILKIEAGKPLMGTCELCS